MPRPTCLLLLACAFALAACQVEDAAIGSRGTFITGGTRTNGYPAVGKVLVGYNTLCTATLVGQKTVLTAAHCMDNAPTTFVLDNGERHSATTATRPPQYSGEGSSYDIAVVLLKTAPSIAPIPLSPEVPKKGDAITLVGYGATLCEEVNGEVVCTEDSGIKREAENTIAFVEPLDFHHLGEGSTCKGDSGGPAFTLRGDELVHQGVTSRGALPCGVQAIHTRVDAFIDWISNAAAGDVLIAGTSPEPEPAPDTASVPSADAAPTPSPDAGPAGDSTVDRAPENDAATEDDTSSAPAHDGGVPAPTPAPPAEGSSLGPEAEGQTPELLGGCAVVSAPTGGLWLLFLLLWARRRQR